MIAALSQTMPIQKPLFKSRLPQGFLLLTRKIYICEIKTSFHIRTQMCQVSATNYPGCNCIRRYRCLIPCSVGYSITDLSCRNNKNKVIHLTIADQHFCLPCYGMMKTSIHYEYDRLGREMMDEGMACEWSKREIDKIRERLRNAEREELGALSAQCGYR